MNKKRLRKDFTLTPEWPSSLPTQCGKCGNRYDPRFSLDIGPCRLGRWLRKIAPWLTLVVMSFLLIPGLFFAAPPMHFALIVIGPSIIAHIIGGLLPICSRLYCHKCNTSAFHPPPKKTGNHHLVTSE